MTLSQCDVIGKIIFGQKLRYVYPANQSNLKSIQKALIGWKKAGPPKKATFVLIM